MKFRNLGVSSSAPTPSLATVKHSNDRQSEKTAKKKAVFSTKWRCRAMLSLWLVPAFTQN